MNTFPAQKCQNRNFCNLLSTSKMLRVFIRSPLPACGGPHRAKKLLLYLVAASVGLAGTPYVHWCFGVSKHRLRVPNACVLISGGIACQDWLPGGLMTPF